MNKNNRKNIGLIYLKPKDYFIKKHNKAKKINKILVSMRKPFNMPYQDNLILIDRFNSMTYLQMVYQIANIYNNNICINMATLKVMQEDSKKYNSLVIAYYMDNIVTTISSSWEYIFQIINKYFELGFVSDRKTKIEMLNDRINSITSDEDINKIKRELSKELIVIPYNIKDIEEAMKKKGLCQNKRTKLLFEKAGLIEVSKLHSDVRNGIIHKESLGAFVSLGYSNIFLDEVLDINNNKQDNIDLINLIGKNIEILGDAIQLVVEIVALQDIPNSIGHEDVIYKVSKVNCKVCGEIRYEPEEITEKVEHSLCFKCKSECNVETGFIMNERNYNRMLFKNLEDLNN